MPAPRRPLNMQERRTIMEMLEQRAKIPEIVEVLNQMECNQSIKRCNHTVEHWLKTLRESGVIGRRNSGPRPHLRALSANAHNQEIQFSDQDIRFKHAMLRAKISGREKVEIGVFKDRRAWTTKRPVAEPNFSGCTSPALVCAS